MRNELQLENSCGKDWRGREAVKGGKFCLFRLKNLCTISKIVTAILLVAVPKLTNAQVKKYQTHVGAAESSKTSNSVAKQKNGNAGKKIVSGRICDSLTTKAIPSATVFLKGANLHVQTDSNGHFKMAIPSKLVKEKMTFVIAAEWYFNKEFILTRKELSSEPTFSIVKREEITVEATADSRVKKSKWWQLKKKK